MLLFILCRYPVHHIRQKKKKKEDLKDVVTDGTVLLTTVPICGHYKDIKSPFAEQTTSRIVTNWERI